MLQIYPEELEISRKSYLRLTATMTDSDEIPDVKWSSSDDSVVAVNEYGGLNAAKDGEVTITAESEDGQTATAVVRSRSYPYQDDELMWNINYEVLQNFRRKERKPASKYIMDYLDKCMNIFIGVVKSEYEATGQWLYIRKEADIPEPQRTDGNATSFVLYGYWVFRNIEDLPGFSPENVESAIEFWQSRQNKQTGLFFDPDKGDVENKIFTKKVLDESTAVIQGSYVQILSLLGAAPKYHTKYIFSRGKAAALSDMWPLIKPEYHRDKEMHFQSSQACATASRLNYMLEWGRKDLLYLAECFVSNIISFIQPTTGTTKKNLFKNYGGSENTLKLLGRIMGYLGVCNLPYMPQLADSMIKYQDDITQGGVPGNVRNMIEMSYMPMIYADYRREELQDAIERMTSVIKVMIEEDADYSGYTLHTIKEGATYLNWEGFKDSVLLIQGPKWGIPYNRRFFVGPYGNWVNVEYKEPHEIAGHPDYSYLKYGMEAVSAEMKKRIIYSKCEERGWILYDTSTPVKYDYVYFTDIPDFTENDEFIRSNDLGRMLYGNPDYSAGRNLLLKFPVQLKDVDSYVNPMLKVRFKGIFDIYLNGVLIKELSPEMNKKEWDWCGFYIRKDQRHALKEGENWIAVKFKEQFDDSYVSVGVIDWR